MDRRTLPQTTPLTAANGSQIAMFGTWEITLDLGFQRTSWTFRLADVANPILGLDFLTNKHLALDFHARRLKRQLASLQPVGPCYR